MPAKTRLALNSGVQDQSKLRCLGRLGGNPTGRLLAATRQGCRPAAGPRPVPPPVGSGPNRADGFIQSPRRIRRSTALAGTEPVATRGVRPASRRVSARAASAARSARRWRMSEYARSHVDVTAWRWSSLASRCAPATANAANSWASMCPDRSAVVADASRGSKRIDHAAALGWMPMRRMPGPGRTCPAATRRASRPASVNGRDRRRRMAVPRR